jgi:hypothetical protein
MLSCSWPAYSLAMSSSIMSRASIIDSPACSTTRTKLRALADPPSRPSNVADEWVAFRRLRRHCLARAISVHRVRSRHRQVRGRGRVVACRPAACRGVELHVAQLGEAGDDQRGSVDGRRSTGCAQRGILQFGHEMGVVTSWISPKARTRSKLASGKAAQRSTASVEPGLRVAPR